MESDTDIAPSSSKIIVYSRPACPMVPPVLHALDAAEAPYTYVDIREDADGKQHVLEINKGNESVPTLVFPDGTTLTEPGLGALSKKLGQMGYGEGGLTRLAHASVIPYAIRSICSP
ncbi:MAG: glutaredoxin domain-containing protein [Chloroflexota bacterium]